MSIQIFFDGLGYRNVITEKDQIIWFLENVAKTKNKANATRYWLDTRERLEKTLLKYEAYELLIYIKEKATDAKQKKREALREKAKKQAQLEMENMKGELDQWNLRRELIKMVRLN